MALTAKENRHRITHKLNNSSVKQNRQCSICRLLLLMAALLVSVLVYATALMLKVAGKNDNIIISNSSHAASGGLVIGKNAPPSAMGAVSITAASAKPSSPSSSISALVDRSHRIEVPDQKRTLAFVHIGKSGGSTISLLLRNGCMSAVDGEVPCEPDRWKKVHGQTHETVASQRIQFYLHTPHVETGNMREYYRRASSVVVVARDPLERFVSAFLCRHPRNIDLTRQRNRRARMRAEARGEEPPAWAKIVWGNGDVEQDQVHRSAFLGCYPNVEELAKCAAPVPMEPEARKVYKTTITWLKRGFHTRDISLNCRDICLEIMAGQNKYIHHVRFNYEAFLKDLPSETEVFVIRTKYLWQDWKDVNNMLGATKDVDVPDKGSDMEVVNARGNMPVRNNLSDSGGKIICEYLKNDVRIYIDLLNRAVNLSDKDVQEALEGLQKSCPLVLKSLIEEKFVA